MDHKQQIYDHGSTEKEVLKALGLPKRNLMLLETFRCCPYIVHLAATLLADPAERTAYRNQAKTDSRGRETPVLYFAASAEEEKKQLIATVRARQQGGEKVAVLLPTQRLIYGYAEALREAGLEVESPKSRDAEDGPYDLDFRSDRTKVMSYHSAKGLTFETVIMPRLVERPFDWMTPDRITNLLFVGISRAVKWIYLGTVEGMELPQVETLQSAEREGSLTIRKDNSIPKSSTG
jgi:superfamily I DNA/RNA helicase